MFNDALTATMTTLWNRNTSSEVFTAPKGCIVIETSGPVPWNNPKDVIKVETQILVNNIKAMIINPILFCFGAPTNLLSMVVFAKHGMKHRTNVCLFTLSFVDLLYGTVCFLLYIEQIWSHFLTDPQYLGEVFQFFMNNHVLGLFGLYWASLYVSATLAIERCLGVTFPLRAQTFLKGKTMWGILWTGVLTITFGAYAVSEKYNVVCMYDRHTNTSSLVIYASEYYVQHKTTVDILDGFIYGLILPVVPVAMVAVATLVTASALKKAMAWRRDSSNASLAMSAKEVSLTKMLICLAIQFVIINLPNVVFRLSGVFFPDIRNNGNYYNLHFLLLGIAEISSTMNASLNFFVYYFTGSKYKETVQGFFNRSTVRTKVSELTKGALQMSEQV